MLLDAGPFLNPLARRLVRGEHADLLAPFRLVDPSASPALASPALADPAVAERRRLLAIALARSNRALGHPRADELARRLADPAALVVVTGQQPGLFGGPLYALSKLLAAVRWAEKIEAETGTPALALYWMATEDHDFAEVASCNLPIGEDGGLVCLELPDDGRDLVPVGRRRLGPGVRTLIESLRVAATTERQGEWADRLAAIYAPERTFGEAFAALMIELLGARCPLLIDALEPSFKAIQSGVIRQLVERREAVGAALARRDAEIERRGLPHQVSPQPGCAPLFLLDGRLDDAGDGAAPAPEAAAEPCRRRLQWETVDGEAGFSVRGGERRGSLGDLLEILERQPERVGPGALARPVVQDAMLGTAGFLVGPGELAYLTQASSLYPVLGVEAPAVALRPQMLLVDARRQGHLAEMMGRGLDPALLLGDESGLEAALAAAAGDDPLAPAMAEVLAAVDRLRAPAIGIDPQLESPWQKTRGQVEKALDALAGRARAARARSDGVLRQRVEALRQLCLPGGGLQERKVAVGYFPGCFGADLATRLLGQLELAAGSIQLLDPTREATSEATNEAGRAAGAVAPPRGEPAAATER
jgi:uncharacterized protein YllA (UPF0747 family)